MCGKICGLNAFVEAFIQIQIPSKMATALAGRGLEGVLLSLFFFI
jgi:hypothetical protein